MKASSRSKPKANPTPGIRVFPSTPAREAWPLGSPGALRRHRVCSHPCSPPPLWFWALEEGGDPDLVPCWWRGPDARRRLCGPSRRPTGPLLLCPLLPSACPPRGTTTLPLVGPVCPAGSLLGRVPLRRRVTSRGVLRRRPPEEPCLRAALSRPCPAIPGACWLASVHRHPRTTLCSARAGQASATDEDPAPAAHEPGFKETPGVPSAPALCV